MVGQWEEAHTQRLKLIDFLTASGGLGTTLDIRRYEGYDGKSTVLQYLNRPEVKVCQDCHLCGATNLSPPPHPPPPKITAINGFRV
jgi:hypothetical protein